ncbi:MAG: energy transducer TonB [Terriglobales bacterium]
MRRFGPLAGRSLSAVWVPLLVASIFTCNVLAETHCPAKNRYQPPQLVAVTDPWMPYDVMIDGVFILDVHIDALGRVVRVDALRNPGAMLSSAVASVHRWKFLPARTNGHSTASDMVVAFVYRPADSGFAGDNAPTIRKILPAAIGPYRPPAVDAVAYPQYPVNAAAWGSVVLDLEIAPTGAEHLLTILLAQPPFLSFARNAAKKWRFSAATLGSRAVSSTVAIAFIFQPPTQGPD